jgi:hypothetical protein
LSTRKTCEAVARVVARMRLAHYAGTCDALATDLADELGATLPRFDRAKFLEATRADMLTGMPRR